jgi:hypothetical protein
VAIPPTAIMANRPFMSSDSCFFFIAAASEGANLVHPKSCGGGGVDNVLVREENWKTNEEGNVVGYS